MQPVVIIPSRVGSRGIVRKNMTPLAGVTPVVRAARIGLSVGAHVVVTSDATVAEQLNWGCQAQTYLYAPAPLHTDTCAMIDVVKDVLGRVPEGDPIILLQPTQPLRTPAHVRNALALLTPEVDSVVSVVELPQEQSPGLACGIYNGWLQPWRSGEVWNDQGWAGVPARRQDVKPAYRRDGTAYCCWRKTVEQHGDLYGKYCVPLIISAEETCALDTPADWAEAERRLQARHDA